MTEFKGFPKELPAYFQNLAKNNNKLWFNEHKSDYEDFVKQPCIDFVSAMGERLQVLVPGINAIPKINQSLFKIHRDVRFSPDKRPYKTNMGLWFWEGKGKRMECSGFYFHLEKEQILFGAGVYLFPKPLLERYRNAVVDKKHGKKLPAIVKNLAKGGYRMGGKHYKKTPRGFDASHPNAEFLLYKGLHAGIEMNIPKVFYTEKVVNLAFEHYKNMLPLHQWLNEAVVA